MVRRLLPRFSPSRTIVLAIALLPAACAANTPDAIPSPDADQVAVPTGEGGLSGLLTTSTADDTASAADIDDECLDEACEDTPEPREPFVPESEHQPFCATLADFEEREQPDFDTAAGRVIALSWLEELTAAASPDIQPAARRLTDKLTELFDLVADRDVIDETELPTEAERLFVQVAAEGEAIDRHIQIACFGVPVDELPGPRSPPTTAQVTTTFCRSFIELDRQLTAATGPEEKIAVVLAWLDEISPAVPEELRADFDLVHAWYQEAVPTYPAAELFGHEAELAPAEVTAASEAVGLYADGSCDL